MKRGEINYSKKLDAAVEKLGSNEWEYLDQHPGYAGMTTFGDNDTNSAVEFGFGMAMRCPSDKSVFSGYGDTEEFRHYVYADNEDDALKVWGACVKAARAHMRELAKKGKK
jgi:hypothetical protein